MLVVRLSENTNPSGPYMLGVGVLHMKAHNSFYYDVKYEIGER